MKRIFFLYFLSKWTQISKSLLKKYVYVWVLCIYVSLTALNFGKYIFKKLRRRGFFKLQTKL